MKAVWMHNKQDWGTPKDLFDKLNLKYHFTLDAASSDENALCANHYTKEEDGLKQSWEGQVVWCNPPYGKQIKDWTRKAYEESAKGAVVVMLLPVRTDVAWFHDYVYRKADIVFIRRRLKFVGADNPAPFPSMLCIWGDNVTY